MDTIEFTATVERGVIEIPEEYRNRLKRSVHVTLRNEEEGQEDMIGHLLKHPLKVKDFRPLSREEAHARK